MYYRGAWYIKEGGIINFLCPTKGGEDVVTNVDISGNEEMERESMSGVVDRVEPTGDYNEMRQGINQGKHNSLRSTQK